MSVKYSRVSVNSTPTKIPQKDAKNYWDYLFSTAEENFNMTNIIPLTGLSEPRCGPMAGGVTLHSTLEQEPPQPLVVRSPSVSLIKWPSTPVRSPSPYNSRQVSFSSGSKPNTVQAAHTEPGETGQPVSLTTLDRDCFIIPVHSLDRFLPAGVPLPVPASNGTASDKKSSNLNVLEVPDPKLCILAHLMSPLEAIDPILESPIAQPLLRQRDAATELLNEIGQANPSVGGMLLANMERTGIMIGLPGFCTSDVI